MVKRTITITTILLILSIVISIIIILNKSSFAADGDIASGASGTCSWVIDSEGVLKISPTDGESGTLDSFTGDKLTNSNIPWYDYRNDVTGVIVNKGVKTNSGCNFLFSFLDNCTYMDLINLDTSNATTMDRMISDNRKLESLDLSSWDTSNVTSMGGLFYDCHALRSLNVDGWNTSNVTSFTHSIKNSNNERTIFGMFANCISIEKLDLSSFNTSKSRNFTAMFSACYALRELDISNFDMKNMGNDLPQWQMFYLDSNLSKLILGPNMKFVVGNNGVELCTPMQERDGIDYTGYWIRESDGFGPFESNELCSNYNSSYAGTWIWEEKEAPTEKNYKIEYYFDGILDESLEEIINGEVDSEINIKPVTPVKHGEKNYTLVSNNHNIVISINDEDNIIRVYYETDVLDYAIDGDVVEGDGIPDKYQIRINYKVENGNWNDGTKGTKTDIITLKDKDGNLSEEGTGTTTIPEVGNKPSEGYEVGSWNEEIPIEVSNKDDGKEFVYSYKKSEKQNVEQKDTDITDARGKIYNPKTDDIVNKYLLVGIGGILVLALVSKIRRKYSRKARKIQF